MNSREMAAPHCDKFGLHESGSHSVMASPKEKAQCIVWYEESKFLVKAQKNLGGCMETMLQLISVFVSGITNPQKRALSQKNIHNIGQAHHKTTLISFA
jgi:hypothetical protein